MRRNKIAFTTLFSCVLLSIFAARAQFGPAFAPTTAREAYNIEPLYQEVRRIVQRHYPNATSHRLGQKIHFEDNTRIFLIHEPLKTGEWQDPREERGPKRGGIYCDIFLEGGTYNGQAATPQSFDKRYFTVYFTTPYSKEINAHLHVNLSYPQPMPNGFMKDLQALFDHFGDYVTIEPPQLQR